eukprot:s631_g32.t1
MDLPTVGYNQRVSELSGRVSRLQQQLSCGRSTQLEQLQKRLQELASRLVALRCGVQSELSPLKEELQKLRERMEAAQRGREINVEEQLSQLQRIDQHLREAFQDARCQSAETEAVTCP